MMQSFYRLATCRLGDGAIASRATGALICRRSQSSNVAFMPLFGAMRIARAALKCRLRRSVRS
jgi:hypothetical protein